MAQDYEEIVRNWYNRLRPEFFRRLTAKYSGLSLHDAENLYQDTFIAVQENLMLGRVREDTSWSSYIMTIGMNMANHEWRKIGVTDSVDETNADDEDTPVARKAEDILKTLPEDTIDFYKDPEVLATLSDELSHTPEPCNSIIQSYYYGDFSMEEIAEEVGFKNADSVKSKKFACMNDFVSRLTAALRKLGFDVTPKKWRKNGKH